MKNFKKIIAVALAGVLLMPSLPFSTPVSAAEQNIEIYYRDKPTNTNKESSVIRGSTVWIEERNTENAAAKPDEDEIKIIKQDGGADYKKNPFFTLSAKKGNERGITPKLQAVLDSGIAADGLYVVTTNYAVQTRTASTTAAGSLAAGRLELKPEETRNISVAVNSEATLTFTKQEGGKFTKLEPNDPINPGVFRDWSLHSVGFHDESTGANDPERWEIILNTGGQTQTFNFYPGITRQVELKDPAGNSFIPPQYKTEYNMDMNKDYSFTVLFQYRPSNDIFLTVRDPQIVLEEVARECVLNSPTQNQYIKLTNANDSFRFITQAMILTTKTKVLNESVGLTWQWIPNPVDAIDAAKDPEDREYANVVRLDAVDGSNRQKANVTPRQQDVLGTLRVSAAFDETTDINKDVDDGQVTADLPIIIHGSGIPAHPRFVRGQIGVPPGLDSGAEQFRTTQEYNKLIGSGIREYLPTSVYEMDAYRNIVEGYSIKGEQYTKKPYQYTFEFNSGLDNGLTKQMRIDATGDLDALNCEIITGTQTQEYKLEQTGAIFDNSKQLSPDIHVRLTAKKQTVKKTANINLKFRFYVAGNAGSVREEVVAEQTIKLSVVDNSPDTIAQLGSLVISKKGTNNPIDGFTFDPNKYSYESPMIEVPYEIEGIELKPTKFATAHSTMGYYVQTMNEQGLWVDALENVSNFKREKEWVVKWSDQTVKNYSTESAAKRAINLPPQVPVKITLSVRAQDPNVVHDYTFIVRRNMPSTDSTLKELQLVDKEGKNYLADYKPETDTYTVRVPYHVEQVSAKYEVNDPKAEAEQIAPEMNFLARILAGGNIWVDVPLPDATPNRVDVKVKVKSASDIAREKEGITNWDDYTTTYTITVLRDPPNTKAELASLIVTDKQDNPQTLEPAFKPDVVEYNVKIPYSVSQIKLTADVLKDSYGTMEVLTEGQEPGQGIVLKSNIAATIPIPAPAIEDAVHLLRLRVTAEDKVTYKEYLISVIRAMPETDASLKSAVVKDQDEIALPYEFFEETTSYSFTVPHKTEKISFTPVANSEKISSITITKEGLIPQVKKVANGETSTLFKLNRASDPISNSDTTKFTIEVLAEDGVTKMVYSYSLTLKPPSNEARLVDLAVSGTDKLEPVFIPSKLAYSANVNKDVKEVSVTAKAADPNATITIEGVRTPSGTASAPITLMDVDQTVTIVVTAEDGVTTNTYTVKLYNANMVPISNNADLKRLEINYGKMTPNFKPSVTTYEVSADEETYSVDIVARPEDPAAKIQVFAGTKEIGDNRGKFAQAIADGENDFSVKVTATDGTTTKQYDVIVYRNEEDKMGTLKPLDEEDIDIENTGDVIIVDVTKYPRINANIFAELKNYPEKTIIFEGNDFSLQFKASDLTRVIPQATVYDFSMNFDPPNASSIYDTIDAFRGNRGVDTTLIYFKDQKLPGPATLTLSLGRYYADEQLYWHYYNAERDRVDYHGFAQSNSRGTITVKVETLGTFIVADKRLAGSEDRSGALSEGLSSTEDLGAEAARNKVNPNTGRSGGAQ